MSDFIQHFLTGNLEHPKKEAVVETKTGKIRQAGSDPWATDFINKLRKQAEEDLWFFTYAIIGHTFTDSDLYRKEFCPSLQLCPPYRKLRLMPREHCKCEEREFGLRELRKYSTSMDIDKRIKPARYIYEDIGEKAEIVRIETEYGKRIDVTLNHPFYTWHGWILAGELTVNDWLAAPRKLPFGLKHEPELASLFGYMVGDGCLRNLSFSQKDDAQLDNFCRLTLKCGGSTSLPDKRNRVYVRGLRDRFRHEGLFGLHSKDKFVPDFVLKGNEWTVRSFLRSLFECDATTKSGRGGTLYTTVSEQLAREVQHLLLKFGIQARLYEVVAKGGMYPGHKHWRVVFTDTAHIWTKQENRGSAFEDRFPLMWRDYIPYGGMFKLKKAGIRVDNNYATQREKVLRAAEFLDIKPLVHLCKSDIRWEKIKKIEHLGKKRIISIQSEPYHTLTIGDVITHNSLFVSQTLPIHIHIQPKESNLYFPNMDGSDCRILIAGESAGMANKFFSAIRTNYERNELLRTLWPHKVWENPRIQAPKWNNEAIILPRKTTYPDPTMYSVGVGGAITGSRPNVLIKDDICTFEAMNSESVMQATIEWHLATRALLETYELDTNRKSLEFIIGTRWSVHDLYSYIIRNDPSVDVVVRSIIEKDADGNDRYIWPERVDADFVEAKRRDHGSMFPLLYMNSAQDPSLVDFDLSTLRYYTQEGKLAKFDEDSRDVILIEKQEGDGNKMDMTKTLKGGKLFDDLLGDSRFSRGQGYLRFRYG